LRGAMRFCTDCNWYKYNDAYVNHHECRCPEITETNLVTGEQGRSSCNDMRDLYGKCGKEATHWIPKEVPTIKPEKKKRFWAW